MRIGEARLRWLAAQFGRPRGIAGALLIGPWLDRIAAPMNRLTLDRLDVGPDDDVLEVGFGGGDLLARLVRATRKTVIGVDVSAAMVRRARRRFRACPNVRVLLGKAEGLPLPDGFVDRVCTVSSLYFWEDPARAFSEIERVLRPGGRLAVTFEPPEELAKWPGHRFGFNLLDEPGLRATLRGNGFVDLETAEGKGRKPERFLCLTAVKPR